MNRKEFIKNCSLACIAGTAIGSFLQACSSTNYFAKHNDDGNRIRINRSEFTKISKDKTIERKYVLVRTELLNFPICVFKLDSNSYSAVLMECTHRSCELHNQGDFLVCPCHGSEFSSTGVVQNPPADQNLKSFKITSDNEYIYVHI